MITRLQKLAAVVTIALFTVSAAQAVDPAANPGLAIGDPMPMQDVAVVTTSGDATSLSDVKGTNGTLVIFTCNHCPYVKAWEERTVALANGALEQGYGVIALNPNDPSQYKEDSMQTNQRRKEEAKMLYPYAVDEGSRLAAAFGATRTPEFFLFDENNALIYHGALDNNADNAVDVTETYLEDALTADLAGNEVAVKTTKSVGCSIKWYK